ncbi:MAG: helix-turn-helix transcriptional regulator [Clostridia bacterium]|nr:helix-turn-helix transcriptional regulator [Clostridia bacterium]
MATMEDLKSTVGHNITALRKRSGMTQAELAEQLCYSDKAISKWECGDTAPDILVLTQLAELFGVSLDYLVSDNRGGKLPTLTRDRRRIRAAVTLLSALWVWLLATVGFVGLMVLGEHVPFALTAHPWLMFVYAVPLSALVIFVFCCIWRWRAMGYVFLSIFLWGALLSLFLSLLLFFPGSTEWPVFLLGVPCQVIICLWPALKKKKTPR